MPPTATPLSTGTHTHVLVHITLLRSQDDFACLPPIRPVYFLSPHYTAMRGAAALSHFQIYKAASDRGGEGEKSMNRNRLLARNTAKVIRFALSMRLLHL